MLASNFDLRSIQRGTITAPAGCGKTHLIADTLRLNAGSKPILVLTHTNAGVAALRGRLDRATVPPRSYRLATIDGWAMRLIRTFPVRSGHDPEILDLDRPGHDYPIIQQAAANLVSQHHINRVLSATYSHLLVDEYQDCAIAQHELIVNLSSVLPTCVLGDPLQAIFGFRGSRMPSWDNEVCKHFPVAKELSRPWRWINAHSEDLGLWLLDVRQRLLSGDSVDLSAGPASVLWFNLVKGQEYTTQLKAAKLRPPSTHDSVLIIADQTNRESQRKIARSTPGAVTVEAVDLHDLVAFGRSFLPNRPNALKRLLTFAGSVMTAVGAPQLMQRIHSLKQGRAIKPATAVEQAALEFLRLRSYGAAKDLLVQLRAQPSARLYRSTIYWSAIRALRLCSVSGMLTLHDASIRIREQNRIVGRPLPRRAVGSTLLLKGLEAEGVVILDADGLDARNLYVAMTRGSKMVAVCSREQVLSPR